MREFWDYWEVDWDTTKRNLAQMLLSRTTMRAIASALGKQEQDVKRWLNGTNPLPLPFLIVCCKFLRIDILDVLVYEGKNVGFSKEKILEEVMIAKINEDVPIIEAEAEWGPEENSAAQIVFTTLVNEYLEQRNGLRSLYDFLVYLPLFPTSALKEAIYRIQGNFGQRAYIEEQLKKLYRSIAYSPSKNYADDVSYFAFSYPSIDNIIQSGEHFCKEKMDEFEAWRKDPISETENVAYELAVKEYIKKLEKLERLEESI